MASALNFNDWGFFIVQVKGHYMYECSKCSAKFDSMFALGLHWTANHIGKAKVYLVNWGGKVASV